MKVDYVTTLKKMRKIIGTFSHSADLQEKLSAFRKRDGKKDLKIIVPIAIRWNSIQSASARFVDLWPQMAEVIASENRKRTTVLFGLDI